MGKELSKTCTHICFVDYTEVTILETIIVINQFAQRDNVDSHRQKHQLLSLTMNKTAMIHAFW